MGRSIRLMAAGVAVLSYGQRSGFCRASLGPDRPFLVRRRIIVTSVGGRVSGVVSQSRKTGIVGKRFNQRRKVNCAFGGGGSDTDVGVPVLTLYELLEIPQEVGLTEIKTAYRQMARRYHPDVCPPSERDECTKRFLQVQEAYEILVDPDLRADYDYRLRNPLSVQALTSRFSHDPRSGQRRRHGATRDDVTAKEVWKAQWEAQLGGLRKLGRQKAGSWAEKMSQKREEQGEGIA